MSADIDGAVKMFAALIRVSLVSHVLALSPNFSSLPKQALGQTAQRAELELPMRRIQIEFLVPSFSLAQCELLQAFSE